MEIFSAKLYKIAHPSWLTYLRSDYETFMNTWWANSIAGLDYDKVLTTTMRYGQSISLKVNFWSQKSEHLQFQILVHVCSAPQLWLRYITFVLVFFFNESTITPSVFWMTLHYASIRPCSFCQREYYNYREPWLLLLRRWIFEPEMQCG